MAVKIGTTPIQPIQFHPVLGNPIGIANAINARPTTIRIDRSALPTFMLITSSWGSNGHENHLTD